MNDYNKQYTLKIDKTPYSQNDLYKHFGAYFLQNGNIIFTLFTFSDVKKVQLQVKPKNKDILIFDMVKVKDCIWQYELKSGIAESNDRYRFVIDYKNEKIYVKDPCSMKQDSYFKWSLLYNHSNYNWSDGNWICGLNQHRISRLSSLYNNLASIQDLRIYELHIGTCTNEGTFLSAKKIVKRISEELKFNSIEIMPVENTYSFNWGYDGVDKYSPNHTYGTPDELKELIDYAHSCNLNVIMDIVPNHLGPDIAELHKTGPYIEGVNCFGYKFNFEKDEYAHYVRDYIIGSALNWLVNYHCDGLRVDMTKFMCSDYTMKQMVAEVNYHCPHCFLIAEDGRDNDIRVTKPFSQIEIEGNELNHNKFIEQIRNNDVSLASIGFDTEWDFPFHKQIASSVLGSWDCRIKNLSNFDYSVRDAQTRVKYPMSHDEIGNIDGTRLISKLVAQKLKLIDRVIVDNKADIGKVSAHASHKLLVSLLTCKLENMSDEERASFYKSLLINYPYTVDEIRNAYYIAIKQHKLAIGKIYSIPGPKMIFQGDESANIAYFKFFRKFSIGPEPYLKDKGYEPGLPAFLDSKLDSIHVSEKYLYINKSIENYLRSLNLLCENNIALSSGQIVKTTMNQQTDTHTIHVKKIYNEIFSVSNFSSTEYKNNFGTMFPKGKWKEILNSDDIKFAGSGEYQNYNKVLSGYSYFSLPAFGIVFFEKID